MRLLIALSLLLYLPSCAYLNERREQRDIKACEELGFKLGTEAFGNCRLKMRSIRVQQDAVTATWMQ